MEGIVSINAKGVIGKNGKLPWHFPEDLQHFKNLTINSTIIMGRKTWDSLPKKPLPNRTNIVITRKPPQSDNRAWWCTFEGLDSVFTMIDPPKPYFVIGGAEIFELLWDKITKFHVTEIFDNQEGDIHISPKLKEDFECSDFGNRLSDNCTYKVYERAYNKCLCAVCGKMIPFLMKNNAPYTSHQCLGNNGSIVYCHHCQKWVFTRFEKCPSCTHLLWEFICQK